MLSVFYFSVMPHIRAYFYDDNVGLVSEMRTNIIHGTRVRTIVEAHFPRRLRLGDEGTLTINVEIDKPIDRSGCSLTAVAPGLTLTQMAVQDSGIRYGDAFYVITASTPGRKILGIRLSCPNGIDVSAPEAKLTVYQDADWLTRVGNLVSAFGIPTLIGVFVADILERRRDRSASRDIDEAKSGRARD